MNEIITALHNAYQECGYVQKGSAPGLNYKFAGEAAFIEAIRPVLIKHGIVFFQSGCKVVSTEGYKTTKGASMNRIVAEFEFTFAHTSGQFIKVTALGEGSDSGDKTAPKCNTGALKYALRQTLLIETGDDPDNQSSAEQQREADETRAERERRAKRRAEVEAWGQQELHALRDADDEAFAIWQGVTQDGAQVSNGQRLDFIRKNLPELFAEFVALGFAALRGNGR